MIEDIKECNARGFIDVNGNPLSNPEFMRSVDAMLLLEAVKDDDITRYLTKLGKMDENTATTLTETHNDNKARLSLLEMQNGT
jgi:hypothetical protein